MNPMTAAPPLTDTLARIQRLPVMSAVAMEVLQSLNGADLDVDALARRIAQDQAIAARVLRVANSPFYGMAGRVASIHDAIMVLGLSAVRSLVLAAAVVTALPAGHCPGFDERRFWHHVIGTAAAAEAMGKALRRSPGHLFLAGLIHDIGRLALVTLYPADYAEVLRRAGERDAQLIDVELEIFGFDHAEAGAALARRWNFPDEIADALACHHAPERSQPGGLAGVLHYADAIAQALDLDGETDSQIPRLHAATVDALGLGRDDLHGVLAGTRARFDSYCLLLG